MTAKYVPPFGSANPNASYENGSASLGTPGSIADARAWEWPQREIIEAIEQAGLTPDGSNNTQLALAIKGLIGPQLQTLKSIQNVKRFNTSGRVSMSATGAGVQVTGWSGFSYPKVSATSLILVWGDFICRSPGGTGSTLFKLNVGTSSTEFTGSNAVAGTAIKNTLVQSIAGLGAGNHAGSLTFYRNDASTWTTVFNPTNADESGYATTPNATLIFAEVEP